MIDPAALQNRSVTAADETRAAGEAMAGPHISPSRLAGFWGVHVDTIYRDIRKGALPAFRLPGGQLRIRVADARRYGRPQE